MNSENNVPATPAESALRLLEEAARSLEWWVKANSAAHPNSDAHKPDAFLAGRIREYLARHCFPSGDKAGGVDFIAVPRSLLSRLEHDAITALLHRERQYGKDAEVCKNITADIETVQRLLSPEWAANRYGPAPTAHPPISASTLDDPRRVPVEGGVTITETANTPDKAERLVEQFHGVTAQPTDKQERK